MSSEEQKQLPEEILSSIAVAYDKYRDRLIAYAEPWGLSPNITEDLVQDTFLIILKQPEKYMNCDNKFSWLSTILRHRIEHFLRDLRYALMLKEQMERQYDRTNEGEISLRSLYSGIVDQEDLEILIQHYVEGVPYKELSVRFNLEEPTCRKRVQRTRERLRKIMGEK